MVPCGGLGRKFVRAADVFVVYVVVVYAGLIASYMRVLWWLVLDLPLDHFH